MWAWVWGAVVEGAWGPGRGEVVPGGPGVGAEAGAGAVRALRWWGWASALGERGVAGSEWVRAQAVEVAGSVWALAWV